jgi:hypothetical protein
MKTTRRSFIRTSGTVILAAGLLGPFGNVMGQKRAASGIYAIPAESAVDPLNYLTRAHFEPFLNTMFTIGDGETLTELRLVDLPDHKLSANLQNGYYGESFSLILAASSRTRMAAGLYTFEHPVLGAFVLNLNPVGRSNRYEAVINRVNR